MIINEISQKPFACFYNNQIYKLNWSKCPNLKSLTPVDVGIDQSSSSTGICIQSDDLLFLTELPRDDMSVSEYKKALKKELDCLLRTLSIRHFIYEKHKHISPLESVINEITGVLKTYTKIFDKKEVKIVGVAPPVWRKGFFKFSDYKGDYTREAIKEACVDLTIQEKPITEKFKSFSHKDYDAYEAYGIINGYLRMNYTETGQRIVNTTMSYREGRNFSYMLFKCLKRDQENTIEYIKRTYADLQTPIIISNKELLLENSLNRLMGEYNEVILVIEEHSEFPAYIIETGKHYTNGEMFIAYAIKEWTTIVRGFIKQ